MADISTQKKAKTPLKKIAIGCGVVVVMGIVLVIALVVWRWDKPTPEVKLSNEMDSYALDYIKSHNILQPGEELLAYYDETMAMDGSEAAIVTTQRVIYCKEGRVTSLALNVIDRIDYKKEDVIGNLILCHAASGQTISIVIGPGQGLDKFKTALTEAWNNAKAAAPVQANN
jgi:hypothetical protein